MKGSRSPKFREVDIKRALNEEWPLTVNTRPGTFDLVKMWQLLELHIWQFFSCGSPSRLLNEGD